MKAVSRTVSHLLAVMAAILLAVWCDTYLPEAIKLLAFVVIVFLALAYTLYAFFSGSRKFSLKKIWKEVLDFMYGL